MVGHIGAPLKKGKGWFWWSELRVHCWTLTCNNSRLQSLGEENVCFCSSVCLSAKWRLQTLSNLLLSLCRIQPDSPEFWKYDRQKQSGSAAVSLSRVQSTEPEAWAVGWCLLWACQQEDASQPVQMGACISANLVPGLRQAKEPQQGREGGLSGGMQQVIPSQALPSRRASTWTPGPSPQSWDSETPVTWISAAKSGFPKVCSMEP